MLKAIAQRLFGRTVVDALGLTKNAWYIDEEQVTATAAELNTVFPLGNQSVTPAALGADVARGGLMGGNGSAIAYNPASVQFLLQPGTGPNVPISVPGMAIGDDVLMVMTYVWNVAWLNSTAFFTAGTNQLVKNSASDLTGYTHWIMWADVT